MFCEDLLYFQHFMQIFCLCPKSVMIITLTKYFINDLLDTLFIVFKGLIYETLDNTGIRKIWHTNKYYEFSCNFKSTCDRNDLFIIFTIGRKLNLRK